MDAKELRLGNYVNYAKEKRVFTCYGINTDKAREQSDFRSSAVYYQFYNKDIYGIKLTEDWLLKFGFKKDAYTEYTHDNLIYNGVALWNKGGDFSLLMYGTLQIKYVHQLQNLYFALTGEELIIK